MASSQNKAERRGIAENRIAAAGEALAAMYGVEVPDLQARALMLRDPDLGRVVIAERTADLLEALASAQIVKSDAVRIIAPAEAPAENLTIISIPAEHVEAVEALVLGGEGDSDGGQTKQANTGGPQAQGKPQPAATPNAATKEVENSKGGK